MKFHQIYIGIPYMKYHRIYVGIPYMIFLRKYDDIFQKYIAFDTKRDRKNPAQRMRVQFFVADRLQPSRTRI